MNPYLYFVSPYCKVIFIIIFLKNNQSAMYFFHLKDNGSIFLLVCLIKNDLFLFYGNTLTLTFHVICLKITRLKFSISFLKLCFKLN